MTGALAGPAFTQGLFDRAAARRGDPDWIAAQWQSGARVIGFDGEQALVSDEGGALSLYPLRASTALADTAVLLGLTDEGQAVFAVDAAGLAPEAALRRDVRGLAAEGRLPPRDLGLVAEARSLLLWHARHRFCANCGSPTRPADGGWRRSCAACEASHFPRTDPVAIVAVTHGDRLLLGRQPQFPAGMYSALAGFVEPGETIEAAAAREIFEEAGLRLTRIRYHSSQPWPFPSSLMIGLIAEADHDALTVDRSELEDARWFSRSEVSSMLAGHHPDGLKAPMPLAIAHHLLRAVLAED
jgi:NAD+ diphosphatase